MKKKNKVLLISGGVAFGIIILVLLFIMTSTGTQDSQVVGESADPFNAQMILAALDAHNRLAESNGGDVVAQLPTSLEEFNEVSEVDVKSMSEADYVDALKYIEYSETEGYYVFEP